MTFLANPLGFTPDEFKGYVAKLHWHAWRPQFMVLHNTAEPSLAQWLHSGMGKAQGAQRVRNLNHYYKDEEGWHSGPHIFVAPDLIWIACDLTADGVHASCYNRVSIGIEMVGDYSIEAFDGGDGARVRDNTVACLAALHGALHISPDTLHFHKQCARDHHNCPGAHVSQPDMIARVKSAMGSAPMTDMAAYYATAATIYKFWLDAGFSPGQAAGLLAQADAESSLNPKAIGDKGQAFGLDQWHQPRVDAIRNGCGVNLRVLPILADQLKAALWELQHTEKNALIKIKAATSAYDAGYAACRFWERPGSTLQYAKRGSLAEKWLVYFSKHPV